MKQTYDSILQTMKAAYFEKTGEAAELQSDMGARFQTVASELYSLCVYADFILKQAFPQTAVGAYLDFHAALRDITRKTAAKARGTLTFYISEPSEEEIVIPSGVICSVEGEPYIQFETTESGVLAAGDTAVTVTALALTEGADGNAPAGTVTVIVNPPGGIEGVRNEEAMKGGTDDESDALLRKRVCRSYSIPQSGVSVLSLREPILKLDEVLDCYLQYDNRNYTVYLRTKSGSISPELEAQIENILFLLSFNGSTLQCAPAQESMFDVVLDITTSAKSREETEAAARQCVQQISAAMEIGESLPLSRVARAVAEEEGVKACEASSPQATGGTIYCNKTDYLRLQNVRVVCHE